MTNISDKRCRENQNTHFIFNNYSRKSCCLWENVEKYGTTRQGTDHNMTRFMRCAGYRHTLGIYNSYFFYTATMFRERASMLRENIFPVLLKLFP